jgi:hypothetical protein
MAEIKDSGNRREFASGAVRDIADGKGRCDLLPLDIVAEALDYYSGNWDKVRGGHDPLIAVYRFLESKNVTCLYHAIIGFCIHNSIEFPDMILEVSKHFEDGARKYGERNWERGIPCHCYLDSGVRHYLKWFGDYNDERHDRAFCWNLLCLSWTLKHRPEFNDLWGDSDGDGG